MTQKAVLFYERYYNGEGRHSIAKNLYGQLSRIRRTEERQRSGSEYARKHKGKPGRNGGPKGV